jgi:hypothetical protein
MCVCSQTDLVPCKILKFDHLISKAKLADDENFQDFVNPHTKFEVMSCLHVSAVCVYVRSRGAQTAEPLESHCLRNPDVDTCAKFMPRYHRLNLPSTG